MDEINDYIDQKNQNDGFSIFAWDN